MRKSGIILLTVFYFIVASGFAINIHYCGGKLKKVSLAQSEGCCCGPKKKTKGCCEEKTLICKIKDNQKTTRQTAIPTNSSEQIKATWVALDFLIYSSADISKTAFKTPPPPNRYSDPVFILNRNFRI